MCRKENQLAAGITGTHIKHRRFIECAVQVLGYCNGLQPSMPRYAFLVRLLARVCWHQLAQDS
jgi:hypothetical protein